MKNVVAVSGAADHILASHSFIPGPETFAPSPSRSVSFAGSGLGAFALLEQAARAARARRAYAEMIVPTSSPFERLEYVARLEAVDDLQLLAPLRARQVLDDDALTITPAGHAPSAPSP
ncbi:MAG: hypothetical protein WKG01_26605 [Kofleriaceae bacterium]